MSTHPSEPARPSPRARRALRQLLEAHERARELALDVWQFALEVSALQHSGVTNTDLRWLVSKGYVEHAVERTGPRDAARTFERCHNLRVSEQSCFVLSAAGLVLARAKGRAAAPPPPPAPGRRWRADRGAAPSWDAGQHTLFCGGQIIKEYHCDAPHQEAILAAFEAQHWARCVSVALPDDPGVSAKERLRNAVRNLNRGVRPYLRFHQEGNGSRVSWEPAAALPQRDPIGTLDSARRPGEGNGRGAPPRARGFSCDGAGR
jgi:hypothetical protein